jgi:hypothetical protein
MPKLTFLIFGDVKEEFVKQFGVKLSFSPQGFHTYKKVFHNENFGNFFSLLFFFVFVRFVVSSQISCKRFVCIKNAAGIIFTGRNRFNTLIDFFFFFFLFFLLALEVSFVDPCLSNGLAVEGDIDILKPEILQFLYYGFLFSNGEDLKVVDTMVERMSQMPAANLVLLSLNLETVERKISSFDGVKLARKYNAVYWEWDASQIENYEYLYWHVERCRESKKKKACNVQ